MLQGRVGKPAGSEPHPDHHPLFPQAGPGGLPEAPEGGGGPSSSGAPAGGCSSGCSQLHGASVSTSGSSVGSRERSRQVGRCARLPVSSAAAPGGLETRKGLCRRSFRRAASEERGILPTLSTACHPEEQTWLCREKRAQLEAAPSPLAHHRMMSDTISKRNHRAQSTVCWAALSTSWVSPCLICTWPSELDTHVSGILALLIRKWRDRGRN